MTVQGTTTATWPPLDQVKAAKPMRRSAPSAMRARNWASTTPRARPSYCSTSSCGVIEAETSTAVMRLKSVATGSGWSREASTAARSCPTAGAAVARQPTQTRKKVRVLNSMQNAPQAELQQRGGKKRLMRRSLCLLQPRRLQKRLSGGDFGRYHADSVRCALIERGWRRAVPPGGWPQRRSRREAARRPQLRQAEALGERVGHDLVTCGHEMGRAHV